MLGIMTADYAPAGKLAPAMGFLVASALKFYGLVMVARRCAVLLTHPACAGGSHLASGSILLAIAALSRRVRSPEAEPHRVPGGRFQPCSAS